MPDIAAQLAIPVIANKQINHPTGCLGLAAVRAMGAQLQGQRVGVILSGGNIDMPRFCALLQAAPA